MHSCMCIAISAIRFQLCHHSWNITRHNNGEHSHIPTHCPSLCPRRGMTVSREIVVFVESALTMYGSLRWHASGSFSRTKSGSAMVCVRRNIDFYTMLRILVILVLGAMTLHYAVISLTKACSLESTTLSENL